MKKGFTLIELLAVIVILAIISLIAVPIVLNIINDAKEESQKRSLNLYMKHAESSITKENLNEKFNPSLCLIQDNSKLICDDKEVDITINGEKPEEGIILLENGKIIKYKNIKLGNLYYHKDLEGNETITKEKLPAICKTDNEVSTELGTKYECDVNNDKTYTFYVLSKEGYNVNLIMNNNICSNTKDQATSNYQCKIDWHFSGNYDVTYGPDTALNYLYNATKNWSNIQNMTMDYEDEGYTEGTRNGYIGIKTINGVTTIFASNGSPNTDIGNKMNPLKARLPKYSEIISAGCIQETIENLGKFPASCPVWLVENLKYFDTTNSIGYDKYEINKTRGMDTTDGYWLLSTQRIYSDVYKVYYKGWLGSSPGLRNYNNGVRPVITITMDELGTEN